MKMIFPALLCVVILAACQSSESSLKEIDNPPSNIVDVINADATLQSISSGDRYYIVLHTTEDVTATSTIENNLFNMHFKTTASKDNTLKEYIYTFDSTEEFDTVTSYMNEKELPFDTVIVTD